jgi:hypothetical protein
MVCKSAGAALEPIVNSTGSNQSSWPLPPLPLRGQARVTGGSYVPSSLSWRSVRRARRSCRGTGSASNSKTGGSDCFLPFSTGEMMHCRPLWACSRLGLRDRILGQDLADPLQGRVGRGLWRDVVANDAGMR